MPVASSINNAQQAIQKLAHAIKSPAPEYPFQLDDEKMHKIETLTKLLHKKIESQSLTAPPHSATHTLPLEIVQNQRVTPTPDPTPAPTRRTANPMPNLIPPDTPTPPMVDTPLLSAAIYNLCSNTIHQTP